MPLFPLFDCHRYQSDSCVGPLYCAHTQYHFRVFRVLSVRSHRRTIVVCRQMCTQRHLPDPSWGEIGGNGAVLVVSMLSRYYYHYQVCRDEKCDCVTARTDLPKQILGPMQPHMGTRTSFLDPVRYASYRSYRIPPAIYSE